MSIYLGVRLFPHLIVWVKVDTLTYGAPISGGERVMVRTPSHGVSMFCAVSEGPELWPGLLAGDNSVPEGSSLWWKEDWGWFPHPAPATSSHVQTDAGWALPVPSPPCSQEPEGGWEERVPRVVPFTSLLDAGLLDQTPGHRGLGAAVENGACPSFLWSLTLGVRPQGTVSFSKSVSGVRAQRHLIWVYRKMAPLLTT